MNPTMIGTVCVGLVMETGLAALGELMAGLHLTGIGRRSPVPGAMP